MSKANLEGRRPVKNSINADYSVMPAGGFLDKLLASQRRKMFDAFNAFRKSEDEGTVLHVSMVSTRLFDNTGYLSACSDSQDKARVTSYEIEPPYGAMMRSAFHAVSPKRHQQISGLHLPFADGEFDWVFGNEIIEHAGSFERQYALLKELTRVSRKGVFVTTSNRWHPIEFNTAVPFLHWLPDAWWRRILKISGKGAWASESVLNLLDASDLYRLASLMPGKPKHDVGHKRIFGIKAHFFLMVHKSPASKKAEKKNIPEASRS